MVEIWHNPRCSKSRATLALLEARCRPETLQIIRYLDTPPDAARIAEVAALLGGVDGLLRTADAPEALVHADAATRLAALAATPALLQRPVVITELGARIGRPPEAVLDILPP